MKNIIISLMAVISLSSCVVEQQIDEEQKQEHYSKFEGPGAKYSVYDDTSGVTSIKYLRDKRTNLCFAYFWKSSGVYQGGPGFTNVPCTDEVVKMISEK